MPQFGFPLPNAEKAVVDIRKLRDYCLNLDHDEGKHKARVFKAALGFTVADTERLRELILSAVRTTDARFGKLLPHGQMNIMDFTTEGLHGNVVIRTAWIIEIDTDFPRLVSCSVI